MYLCGACWAELKGFGPKNRREDGMFCPPKFSLANNLWIGDIPWQLRVLSFSKQLLIVKTSSILARIPTVFTRFVRVQISAKAKRF